MVVTGRFKLAEKQWNRAVRRRFEAFGQARECRRSTPDWPSCGHCKPVRRFGAGRAGWLAARHAVIQRIALVSRKVGRDLAHDFHDLERNYITIVAVGT